MTDHCPQLEQVLALADGELVGSHGDLARAHLAWCTACQAELAETLQLAALPAPVAVTEAAPAPAIPIDRARPRRSRIAVVLLGAAAAAAAVAIVVTRDRGHTSVTATSAIALAPRRSIEARLTWQAAAAYRPYDVDRGADNRESISLGALAELERTGDGHGLGALSLLAGDTDRAATYLAGAGADVASDRAALALMTGDPETALTITAAILGTDPDHAAARWNHALALRDLGLVRAAVDELRRIAGNREPANDGWSEEAATRADALAAATDARAAVVDRAMAAGANLIATGAGFSPDLAGDAPGLARLYLYDALRAAPTRARAVALRPLAAALDAVAGDGAAVRAVDRVAAADFTRRAPLAKAYARIVAGELPAPPARGRLLAAIRAAGQDDLLIGALIRLGPDGRSAAADDVPELARAARTSGDPWFELLAVEQDARRLIAAGDPQAAETALATALDRCATRPLPYRCAKLGGLLAAVHLDRRRITDARAALDAAWRTAASSTDGWLLEQDLIAQLAEVHAMRDDARGDGLALARAYARELMLRNPDSCEHIAWAHELAAMVLVNQVRFDDARRELAAARCEPRPITLRGAFVSAHVVRDGGSDTELAALRADLAALRADPAITPAQHALLDHVEGRALIDRDREAGERLLTAAIVAAETFPSDDLDARKARAYSYAVLVLDAGRRGDADAALGLLGAEVGVVPGPCTLGVAVEDRRRFAVVRDAAGVSAGVYAEDRASTAFAGSDLVPASLLDRLVGCDVTDVLARAPIQGAPDLIAGDRAWRYRTARSRPVGSTARSRRIVIADVVPPARLGLPALATWRGAGGDAQRIEGSAATPDRVVAAMRDATWIEIHAHGVTAPGNSEASFLALSPDAAGRYALTARDVRAAVFAAGPVVVLAACEAARGAPVIDGPSSLPAAFVAAGARAVIASDAPLPDRDAVAFFTDLRDRIDRGTGAAIALRDARRDWKARGGAAWVDHLMVFE